MQHIFLNTPYYPWYDSTTSSSYIYNVVHIYIYICTTLVQVSILFFAFSVSACAAAPRASLQMPVDGSHKRCTSTQVVSHTKNLPFDHGTMITPSGHFPSALCKPDDSTLLGMFAKANEE